MSAWSRIKSIAASFACVLVIGCLVAPVVSVASPSKLEIREAWRTFFSGQTVTCRVELKQSVKTEGRLLWRLMTNGATFQRGESLIGSTDKPFVELSFKLPTVKPGVSIESSLILEYLPAGAKEVKASLVRPLWIYSDQAFAHRQKWLKSLDIHLFDPESKTSSVFSGADIPFTLISNPDGIPQAGGLLIIGEDVSFLDYRALPKMMIKAANLGVNVLCLAPSKGAFVIAEKERPGQPSPSEICFRDKQVINALDKNLDANAWPPTGEVVRASFKLVGSSDPMTVEASGDGEGWPWVKLSYSGGGSVTLVGFSIVAGWNDSPSPRYLLARLLEQSAEGHRSAN